MVLILEGLVMESERDRLQRYSDCDFLMQVKHNADIHLKEERNLEERIDTVCTSISPRGRSVFKPTRLVTDLVSHLDLRLI